MLNSSIFKVSTYQTPSVTETTSIYLYLLISKFIFHYYSQHLVSDRKYVINYIRFLIPLEFSLEGTRKRSCGVCTWFPSAAYILYY
jgi:hypothetical protein